ncbi:hypothetical protein [Roseimaritima ulvae]|uniref:Uncharacterized protein n=1 Tax=Roseimaritima ulvae TaxID=980254 RepID=A0A5B9QSN0_9BACT|nr:hypothetical protein [Roseimaritima ulvae]QEG42127.1 hypothetical protein UC8_41600 [Roseimaritima ulvae]
MTTATRKLPALALLLFGMTVSAHPSLAQPPMATIHDTPAQRLAYMQASGQMYEVSGEQGAAIEFEAQPVLRFTNPVSGLVDGGLFVWKDETKRPVAIAQFFIAPNTEKLWIHEFQSLAEVPLEFRYKQRVVWAPSKAGVEFKPLTDVSAPADSASRRLLQMKQIAKRMSVQDGFEGGDADELRLMTTPLVRYRNEQIIDGALFTFAHGTDPELLVLVEARPSSAAGKPAQWHMAVAPMTSYAITAERDGATYWSVPWRKAPHPINAVFKNFVFPPQP